MKRKMITEESGIHKEWYKRASEQTLETLPIFLSHIMNDYRHDYGTICHALSAGAIATAWAMNKHESGGITGFQGGAVMWEFIRNWNYSHNKTGLKLVDYDNFLYPQYEDKYQKTMSQSTFDAIKKEAARQVKDADDHYVEYLIKKERYETDLKAFIAKYPDYYERKEHYDHLGMGNAKQWEEEEKKRANGFDFAPKEPYKGVSASSPVYQHWQRIIKGIVPFGYVISER